MNFPKPGVAGLADWLPISMLVILTSLGLLGCGGGSDSGIAAGTKSFQSAPAEVQTAWATAVAASKTNDYAAAYLTLRDMQSFPNLTPEQSKAVNDLSTSVNNRMSAAAGAGDTNALKAVEEVRQSMRQRVRTR